MGDFVNELENMIGEIEVENEEERVIVIKNRIKIVIVINCVVCMTASLYSIPKACLLQSK